MTCNAIQKAEHKKRRRDLEQVEAKRLRDDFLFSRRKAAFYARCIVDGIFAKERRTLVAA